MKIWKTKIKWKDTTFGQRKEDIAYSFISCDIILDEADVDELVSWLSAPQDAAAKATPNEWMRVWNARNAL